YRGGRHGHQAVHQRGERGLLPGRRPLLHGEGRGVREVCRHGATAAAGVSRGSATSMPIAAVKRMRPQRAAGKPAPAATLTEQAYRQLEEQIVTLRLKPGEFLSEHVLAANLSIGRTPIREALQRLAREGLVTILPRKGILVSETDPRKQLLVLEV